MENQKGNKESFKNDNLSKKAFENIHEIKNKINSQKIPTNLLDALEFRYFASGGVYRAANETRIAKEMIILHGLFGVPKIIPTIYFYGPYPYLLSKSLEKSKPLKEKSIQYLIKNSHVDLENVDATEQKRKWELNQKFKDKCSQKYNDLNEFKPLFSELNNLDGKSLINLSYDIILHRNKPSMYPRVIHVNEDKNSAVLYSIAVLANKRLNYLEKYNKKITKFDKRFTEQSRSCKKIIFEENIQYVQELKNSITNKMLILNALSLYHTVFNMKPTIDDLCYALCSHFSLFDIEINNIEESLEKDFETSMKIKNKEITIKYMLNKKLIFASDFSECGDYVNTDDKIDDVIIYLNEIGYNHVAHEIKKKTYLTSEDKKNIENIVNIMQMKEEIKIRILALLNEIKDEKMIHLKNDIVTLNCSFVENSTLKDGNVVDRRCWSNIINRVRGYSS